MTSSTTYYRTLANLGDERARENGGRDGGGGREGGGGGEWNDR